MCGVAFLRLTRDQASHEAARPRELLQLRVQHSPTMCSEMVGLEYWDSLYVKCLCDYTGDKEGELSFEKFKFITKSQTNNSLSKFVMCKNVVSF